MESLDGLHIVNYCHKNCVPLKNIMRLPKEEAFSLAAEMARQNPDTTAFWRFADFHNYYPERLDIDARLHQRFLQLGGQPEETHPLSFVLEGSKMLDGWFGHGIVTCLPLSAIPDRQISFTYGDSMTIAKTQGDFTLLTKAMLAEAVEASGGTAEAFVREANREYHYIEVQVWGKYPSETDPALPDRWLAAEEKG